jgi:hypothetical protein
MEVYSHVVQIGRVQAMPQLQEIIVRAAVGAVLRGSEAEALINRRSSRPRQTVIRWGAL